MRSRPISPAAAVTVLPVLLVVMTGCSAARTPGAAGEPAVSVAVPDTVAPLAGAGGGEAATSTPPAASALAGVAAADQAPSISWAQSLPEARARAARERRMLLVWVSAGWAAESYAMSRQLWSDARIRRALRPVVTLALDLSEDDASSDRLLAEIGTRVVPALVLYARDGRELGRIEGAASAEQLLGLLADSERRAAD
jgi:thiol:disulfide interchange protein